MRPTWIGAIGTLEQRHGAAQGAPKAHTTGDAMTVSRLNRIGLAHAILRAGRRMKRASQEVGGEGCRMWALQFCRSYTAGFLMAPKTHQTLQKGIFLQEPVECVFPHQPGEGC